MMITMRRLFPMLLVGCGALMLACGGGNIGAGAGRPGGGDVDNDGDGYTATLGDCDDNDPQIYPGAPERENCRDDNCDGRIDEGTPNEDLNGNGLCPSSGDNEQGGSSGSTGDADGDGYTVANGDCNDHDPSVNPGAMEVAGLGCESDAECASSKCIGGFCRCTGDAMCSSNVACAGPSDCTREGETCSGGKCVSSTKCLPAVAGMVSPEFSVCRDNVDNDCNGQVDELAPPCDNFGGQNATQAADFARAMDLCKNVISASFGASSSPQSRAVLSSLAAAKTALGRPRKNNSMAVLSTGLASYDAYSQCPQDGTGFGGKATDPDPTAPDKSAMDLSSLTLEIQVPSNANSFSFDFHFLTTEYPEYLDTEFNDTFWVRLESKKFNGNISFDKNGTPIRLNAAFFDVCDPSPSKPKTLQGFCNTPAAALDGTGYYKECSYKSGSGWPGPGSGEANGGSTGWLTTTAPVEPGEKIRLTFYIFDKGDDVLDSTVLIDNFRWKLAPALTPKTQPKID